MYGGSIHEPSNAADRLQSLVLKGCTPIGRSLRQTPWHRSYGYDLRRLPCDHPDWDCNAAHGRLVQSFPNQEKTEPQRQKGSLAVWTHARAPEG